MHSQTLIKKEAANVKRELAQLENDQQSYGIITVKNLDDEDGELLKRARAHGHPDWRNRGMTVEGNLK